MKYAEFDSIDKYTKNMIGEGFSSIRYTMDTENVIEAFNFMVSFEKSDKFTQSSLKIGEKEALDVLSSFENQCKEIKDAADQERKKERAQKAEAIANAPVVWKNEIAPDFKNIFKRLEEFKNIPGYQTHLFSDAIEKEFGNIKNMLGIVDKHRY